MSRYAVPVLVAAAVLWTIRTPAAQQGSAPSGSAATFRTEINFVEVSARVVDEQGNFVHDLKQSDFQIFEDKKPQAIAAFDMVDIPVERFERPLFTAAPIEPDVATNAGGFEGRIYMIVLDALHTDPMRTPLVRAAARKFVNENLGANDLAAVAVIGIATPPAQELTSNHRLLIAAIDKFVGQKPESTAIQQVESNSVQVVSGVTMPGTELSDPDEKERLSNAKRTFTALTQLSEWMSGVRGRRKAIVYLSEGLDYDIAATYNNFDRSPNSNKTNSATMAMDESNDVIAAATRNNVTLYAVDPRGLTNLGSDSVELAMLATQAPVDTALGTTDPSDPAMQATSTKFQPDYGLFTLQDELRLAQDSLRSMSEGTGGFAAVNSNDFTSAFKRIVDDNSSYYLLGYYSSNDRRDGKFRNIDVRIPGHPGLVVRARKGYVAPRKNSRTTTAPVSTGTGTLTGQLSELITSPVPVAGGMTFSATAASFDASPAKNHVVVTLEANGADLTLKSEDGRYTGKIDTVLVAFDRDGKPQGSSRSTVDLGLKPESYQRLQQNGRFRLVSQIDLPPGTYRLEAALIDTPSKKAGSLAYDLEVPDFTKLPVAISNLIVSSATTSFWPTVADKGLTFSMPLAPTAVREFATDDAIALFAKLYDNQKTPPHMIDVTASVRGDGGRAVFDSHQEHSSQEIQDARGGFDYALRFPLKGFAPGIYVLNVEVQSRLGKTPPVTRTVQFRVR